MSNRFESSDKQLRALSFDGLARDFRKALKQWGTTTDEAMGAVPLSADRRQQIDDEVRWGIAKLHDLERAIKLRLPQAVAVRASELSDLLAGLKEYFDWRPTYNAVAGEVNRRIGKSQAKARRANDNRRQKLSPKRTLIENFWLTRAEAGEKTNKIVDDGMKKFIVSDRTMYNYRPAKLRKNSTKKR